MDIFPKNFLWGAATSAYQVEGGNFHSDWWDWEKTAGKENSGEACRHYSLYEKDFDMAQTLGHNAHRFSIEWSRVEPEEGHFSETELKHYLDVVLALKKRGMEPIITLHHFTNPIWFQKKGGWEKRDSICYFLRYTEKVIRALAGHVHYWTPFNEPNIYFSHAYLMGVWPPQEKSLWKMSNVQRDIIRAHIETYKLIHGIYKELGLEPPAVGVAKHLQAFIPCLPGLKNRLGTWLRHTWFNLSFLNAVTRKKALDFIGVNYYSRQLVEVKKWNPRNFAEDVCQENHRPVKKNSLGWDIYPEGLYDLLLKLKIYRLPVLITENGICTEDDSLRWEFIRSHLKSIHRAIQEGVPVKGYLYWSLLDNFEWDKGFTPRFGLADVDYSTYRRTLRESALQYGEVCKTGALP